MLRRKFFASALTASLLIHTTALLYFWNSQFSKSQPTDSIDSLVKNSVSFDSGWGFDLGSGGAKAHTQTKMRTRSIKSRIKNSPVKLKLFESAQTLAPSPFAASGKTVQGEALKNSRSQIDEHTSAVAGSVESNGTYSVGESGILGHAKIRREILTLTNLLHEELGFHADMHSLTKSARVYVELSLEKNQGAPIKRLLVKSNNLYLGVYVVETLQNLALEHWEEIFDSLLEKMEIEIAINFHEISLAKFKKIPYPVVQGRLIKMERPFATEHSVDLGVAGLNLTGGNSGLDYLGALSFDFEIESLFSRKHRKRYGLDGKKVIRAKRNVQRDRYLKDAQKYMEQGILKLL